MDIAQIIDRQSALEKKYENILRLIEALTTTANTSSDCTRRYEELDIGSFIEKLSTRIHKIKNWSPGADDYHESTFKTMLNNFDKLSEAFTQITSYILTGAKAFPIGNTSIAINPTNFNHLAALILENTEPMAKKADELINRNATLSQINDIKKRLDIAETGISAITETYIAGIVQKVRTETEQDKAVNSSIIIPAKSDRSKEIISYRTASWGWLAFATITLCATFYTLTAFYNNQSINILGYAIYTATSIQDAPDAAIYASLFREFTYKILTLTLLTSLAFFGLRQYNLNKNMQLHAQHKKQALESFEDFMKETHTEPEARATVLNKTLNAVYHLPDFGYLNHKKETNIAEAAEIIKAVRGHSD